MLFDLDQGIMTVWMDDVNLGVMQARWLNGPRCWAVSMFRGSARIESAPGPAPPTGGSLLLRTLTVTTGLTKNIIETYVKLFDIHSYECSTVLPFGPKTFSRRPSYCSL